MAGDGIGTRRVDGQLRLVNAWDLAGHPVVVNGEGTREETDGELGFKLRVRYVLVHVTSETQRHAGHADIIREWIDGSAGLLDGHHNLRIGDPTAWRGFHDQIEDAARLAGGP